MKKLLLVMAFALTLFANAQNFPGESVELLSGRELKVLPVDAGLQKYGYDHFYADATLDKRYK